ncbi:MAG: type II and III secretion system protein [Kiritimatiellae bacterium]|nr:type II and III secretion system protein [Kiritimatiellia bacterium]
MTQIQKFVALGAAVVGVGLCQSDYAQDDLDDLLKALESEVTPAAEAPAKTEAQAAPVKEEVPAFAAEAPEPVKPSEVAAEPAPEAPAAEESTSEEPVAETPAAEQPEAPAAEEPAAESAETETEKQEEPVAESAEAEKAEEPAAESAGKVEEAPSAEEPAATVKAEEAPVAESAPAAESATASEAAPAKKEAPSPEAELLANIVTTEKVRRSALDAQAKREIAEARASMSAEEYTEAVRHYGIAAKLINDRESMKPLRKECEQGMAEGLYRAAMQEDKIGRRERATRLMTKALDMRHPKAHAVLERWAAEGAAVVETKDVSEIMHRKNDEDYKTQREQIRRHLRRSRQYLALREMEKALEECEIVLVNDPYNESAIRLRNEIQTKRQWILRRERKASRDGMIADVDEAWRPVYAVNASQLNTQSAETSKISTGDDPERTQEQDIERRMKEMRLPNISFKPPATIIDAVEFFRQASKDYDRPDIPAERRGFNFVLRTPLGAIKQQTSNDSDDFSASAGDDSGAPANGLEPIQTITASDITFYEAMKLVCDSVGYKFIVRGPVVMVMPSDMSTAELLSRKYNVPEAFVERVSNASEEIKTMGGFGANNNNRRRANESEEEGEGQDWKAFFEEMGVKWPEGSSIKHIKALGKLYVRNTRENLAEFEKVLDELGGQPQLIEIETRFVEVSQEDLNSLGFEWLLNTDYSLNIGDRLGKALGVRRSTWGSETGTRKVTSMSESSTTDSWITDSRGSVVKASDFGGTQRLIDSVSSTHDRTYTPFSKGGTLMRDHGSSRKLGLNAFGGDSEFGNGNRYLSTIGNHISGESNSSNDQFMRVNAFLGNADLSMILHMLSQRSDTDLLSAPKIVTKSGENAVIKVVTEYIYPQDYDVQLQSSSSSSSGSSGGSQSAILAVVEPQNFTMREVGVILDVTPTYSEANGGTIDLELKPQVVDEPTWRNYGMKIPFTGNSSPLSIGNLGNGPFPEYPPSEDVITRITTRYWDAVATLFENIGGGGSNITYYDAPMEQPFFHVRSIDSKVSITPGSTVVMGGLITEQRKAMDDKVPFLGDLPFIGRLFRSHAEQTVKRNLLIFVTGRLITPAGRELRLNEERIDEAEVKAAPSAE